MPSIWDQPMPLRAAEEDLRVGVAARSLELRAARTCRDHRSSKLLGAPAQPGHTTLALDRVGAADQANS